MTIVTVVVLLPKEHVRPEGLDVKQPIPESAVPTQALRAGLAWGQQQFQLLLQERSDSDAAAAAAGGQLEDVRLEELRYRWMLHKSKLKDVRALRSRKHSKVGHVVMADATTRWQCNTTPLLLSDTPSSCWCCWTG